LKGAILVKLTPEKDKKTGRMMMKEVAGSEYEVKAELVLIAAGFLGSESYITEAFGVKVNERTNVLTDTSSHKTTAENVFTAGDMHLGQSLVVRAIREGIDCAREVDESLMGYTNL
ncbi:MAG: FAD-dependent oxidoreductase, partial [Clostridia bacterium]|nr:FAD-dependent oxidoreductase [Clostridia bacterium]